MSQTMWYRIPLSLRLSGTIVSPPLNGPINFFSFKTLIFKHDIEIEKNSKSEQKNSHSFVPLRYQARSFPLRGQVQPALFLYCTYFSNRLTLVLAGSA